MYDRFKYKLMIAICLFLIIFEFPISATGNTNYTAAYQIKDPKDLIKGYSARGKINDYVLENNIVKVIIGNLTNSFGYMETGGNIIDATLKDLNDDRLENIYTYYGWPKQAIYKKIQIESPGGINKEAVIKVSGFYSGDELVEIETYYRIYPLKPLIEIKTILTNKGKNNYKDFPLGDVVNWGYVEDYIPGMGSFILKGYTDFFAGASPNFSYAVFNEKGKKIYFEGIYPDPIYKVVQLSPGKSVSYTRYFVIEDNFHDLWKYTDNYKNFKSTLKISYKFPKNKRIRKVIDTENLIIKLNKFNKEYKFFTLLMGKIQKVKLPSGTYKIDAYLPGFEPIKLPFIKLKERNFKEITIVFKSKDLKIKWGPFLSNVKENSIDLMFKFPIKVKAIVKVKSKKKGEIFTFRSSEEKKLHKMTLELPYNGENFNYSIEVYNPLRDKKEKFGPYYFKLAKKRLPIKIIAYGDTRNDQEKHFKVIKAIKRRGADFILNTGDLVNNGRRLGYWDRWFKKVSLISSIIPYYVAPGNHEKDSFYYYQTFPFPQGGGKYNRQWYSFNYAGVHIICLDSNIKSTGYDYADIIKETEWLEKDLKGNTNAKWKIVVFHHPFYSKSSYQKRTGLELARYWEPLFKKYSVDIVINGHVHAYQHLVNDGIHYLITGGGGAPFSEPKSVIKGKVIKQASHILHFVELYIYNEKINAKVWGLIKNDPYNLKLIEDFNINKLSKVKGGK